MAIEGLGPYNSMGNWGQSKQQNQQDSSFVSNWAYRDLLWSLRLGTGEAIDRYLGSAKDTFRGNDASHMADFGFTDLQAEEKPAIKAMTYGSLLKVNDGTVAWKDLSWKTYEAQVRKNTYLFREAIASNQLSHFFDGVTVKGFAKEILWEGNIRPFKELAGDTPRVNMGTNLAYVGGLGLLGWDILNSTRKAYQQAHQQEDGSWQSHCCTWMVTAQALVSKTVKSLASWEAAGVGMAIGKALIPITGFPFGGILVGSFFGTSVYTLLNKCFQQQA